MADRMKKYKLRLLIAALILFTVSLTSPGTVTANDWKILAGVRVGDISLSLSTGEILQILGEPSGSQRRGSAIDYYWDRNHLMGVTIISGIVELISTKWYDGRAHPYETDKGIRIGASVEDVRNAYGSEEDRRSDGGREIYAYWKQGISFLFLISTTFPSEIRGRVAGIQVFRPNPSWR